MHPEKVEEEFRAVTRGADRAEGWAEKVTLLVVQERGSAEGASLENPWPWLPALRPQFPCGQSFIDPVPHPSLGPLDLPQHSLPPHLPYPSPRLLDRCRDHSHWFHPSGWTLPRLREEEWVE